MGKEILIYDSIGQGGITAKSIISQLKAVEPNPIDIKINSPGGEFFEGIAIYNAIKNYEGEKVVHIDGLAYGIAFIIALAVDEINIHEKAFIGIAKPFIPMMDDNKIVEEKLVLKKAETIMSKIISTKLGKPKSDILKMMRKESWLNADEAITQGFVKSIYY